MKEHHPIDVVLRELGWTQQRLADEVNALGLRQPNGRPLRLCQSHVSEIKTGRKGLSTSMAKAIAKASKGRTTAEALMFHEPKNSSKRRKAEKLIFQEPKNNPKRRKVA